MKNIKVQLREPSDLGRLCYYPDPETEPYLLLLKSRARECWSYFIHVDGDANLSMDADRTLRDVEVVVGRHAWKTTDLQVPMASRSADLEIQVHRRNVYVELHVSVMADRSGSYARVLLGDLEEGSTWVALSGECWAEISRDRLKGFFVVIKGNDRWTPVRLVQAGAR